MTHNIFDFHVYLYAFFRLTRQRLSDDDDDNDDDEDMEDIANFENELSRNDEIADNKMPAQKPKRGRKMLITLKETDGTMIEESTTILNDNHRDNAQLNLSAKKKKKGRKSVTNQSRQESNTKTDDVRNVLTASTSDEDEECSFANCIRPTGNDHNRISPPNLFFHFISLFHLYLSRV